MLLLHQQSRNNQTLKIAARLSLPAQRPELCFAAGVLCWGAHRELCSRAGFGAAEPDLFGGGRRQVPQQCRECCGLKSYCQSMYGNKEISSNFWCSFLQGTAVFGSCGAADGDGNGRSSC